MSEGIPDVPAPTVPALSPSEMFKDFVQIGVVVTDLDQTVKVLSEAFGLGPWRFIKYPPEGRGDSELVYRGQPGHFSHRIGFTSLGPIELEVVQPLEGASGLTEFLEQHGPGLHHIRFNVPETQPVLDYLAGHGVEVLMSGAGIRPGTHWYHLDTTPQAGFVLEIMNVLAGSDGRTPNIVDGKVVA